MVQVANDPNTPADAFEAWIKERCATYKAQMKRYSNLSDEELDLQADAISVVAHAARQHALTSEPVTALIKRATHMRHVLLCSHITEDERSPQKQAAREFDEALRAFEAAKHDIAASSGETPQSGSVVKGGG